jgi:SAM-dependent methyltransferase
MLDHSLFICYSTPNYSKLTNIFLESLNSISVKNISHLIDNPKNVFNNTGFQTDLWYYCVRSKINHLISVLNNHDTLSDIKYFIFTDCDVIYIKNNINEWYNLEKDIINDDKDIYFMREFSTSDVNSGFFIIKNNSNLKNIINFFTEVLEIFDKTEKKNMPLGDQTIINNLKTKINYGHISNDYTVFGTTIYNKNRSLFHHAIYCIDVEDKIEQVNKIKDAYEVDINQHKNNLKTYNMSYPLEYEGRIYRNENSHLKNFSVEQLSNHYSFYGKHEGLICSRIKNRNDFFNLINKNSYILEIGPLCNPLMDINNPKVKTLDYFTQEELKNNYKNDANVNINNIVKVDYCVRDVKKYSDIIHIKFDFCVSSHNIEHTPCFVSFLQNISSILEPGGFFFLAIPDYRFCFDRFKKPSDIFGILNRYYSKIEKPQSEQILEDKYFGAHNNSGEHWNNFSKMYSNIFVNMNEYESFIYSKKDEIVKNISDIKNIIETNNERYIDTHCWKLTPFTFSYIIDILVKTKLIDLSIERVYRTIKGSHEFYAILKKI